MGLCEFEASLVYRASSRTARADTEKPCLGKQPPPQKKKKRKRKRKCPCHTSLFETVSFFSVVVSMKFGRGLLAANVPVFYPHPRKIE
jgi:hypothetical protein